MRSVEHGSNGSGFGFERDDDGMFTTVVLSPRMPQDSKEKVSGRHNKGPMKRPHNGHASKYPSSPN